MRFALPLGLLLTAFVLLAAASPAQASIVGVGGDCGQAVHVECDAACHLYVGASVGQCIVYGPILLGVGGECRAAIHVSCGPVPDSQTGHCVLQVDGTCRVY